MVSVSSKVAELDVKGIGKCKQQPAMNLELLEKVKFCPSLKKSKAKGNPYRNFFLLFPTFGCGYPYEEKFCNFDFEDFGFNIFQQNLRVGYVYLEESFDTTSVSISTKIGEKGALYDAGR